VFSAHFSEDASGRWIPTSKAGEYTEARLRLNRKHLVEVRALLREVALLRGKPPVNWDNPAREQIVPLLSVTQENA
jgi:hypothetical protein